ncbi:hypothetical protein ACJ41O_013387 [Fusarium nematophilum]
MASWETVASRFQDQQASAAHSINTSIHKSLPPLPGQKIEPTTVTTITSVKGVTKDGKSPSNKGWKPLSLSTPILLAVIALTLLLVAAVETIAQRSAAQGGLALSPTLDDLPGFAKFSYLYVPTIIAVLYSMVWSWIDLDVKRMQPWFELSKPGGATGEDSLFLDYQYEFVALVPFKAARRKHWPVFFGGTAMVIVFWLLTPLQSALLGTGVVKQTEVTTIGNRSQLLPMSQHEALLDPEFLNTGYAVGWLNQPFPAFTTSKYALLPFYAEKSPAPAKVESNLTAVTTKLWTELKCWPAEMVRDGPRSKASFFFLNGQGCNTTVAFNPTAHSKMLYIGYSSSPYSDLWIGGPSCPKTANSTHQFLAIWSKATPVSGSLTPNFNITALFCQPQYYKQQVLATVKSSDFEPDRDSVQPVSPRQILSDREFNSTAFEFILANGMADRPIVRDFPFNIVVEQHPRLNYTNFTQPVSNMVGFAVAGKDLPGDSYSDPEVLQKAYYDAHQYLFSIVVNKLLTNETEMPNRTASTEYFLSGVIVSRAFATTLDCLLVVIAAFAAVILWFCRKAPSNLPMNPSSISRYIDLFRNSADILASFRSMDNATEECLLDKYKGDRFRLRDSGDHSHTTVLMDGTGSRDWQADERKCSTQRGYYDPVRPWVLRRGSGALFVAVLIGAVIFLSYLKQQEARLNGLHRPSENFEVQQLLENYIPTIFATFIEPLWVLLNRLLCVLQPFRDLWEGKARPSRSLDATYTSIPPQLVFWRAAKSGHLVLVMVCTMALLANLLAVGLGSLFNEGPMIAKYEATFRSPYESRFDNSSVYLLGDFLHENLVSTAQYQDHLYIALANISSGTVLPPWVSRDYYFQRHEMSDSAKGLPEDRFNLSTRGFGVNANCTAIPTFNLPIYTEEPKQYMPGQNIPESRCGREVFLNNAGQEMRETGFNRTSGVSSVEFCNTLTSAYGAEPCDKTLTLGWGRTEKAENVNGTVGASLMMCYPVFETAMFNVTIDPEGHVLAYERTSKLEETLNYTDSRLHTDMIFRNYNHQWDKPNAQWHNDTVARDWMNYFIVVKSGSRSVVDPDAPVPDAEDLLPYVEDIYRRLYPIFLSLNEHLFEQTDAGKSTTALRLTEETRIFMEDASFVITMTVLAANIVVAALLYCRSVAFVLPRMPTTIGSVVVYIAPSRLVTSTSTRMPGQADRTFSFGRYVGQDGEAHLGIELDPHVVPVEPSSLRGKGDLLDRLWGKATRRKEQPVTSGTWL